MVAEEPASGKKEHVGNGVFKSHGDEGRDGKNDGENFVGDGASAIAEPNGEADEDVAEHAAGEGLGESEAGFGVGDFEGDGSNGGVLREPVSAEVDEQNDGESPDEVAD